MKTFVRVLIVLVTIFGTFLSLYYLLFGLTGLIFGEERPRNLDNIVSYILAILIAAIAGIYAWKQSGERVVNIRFYMIKVGFIFGFVFFMVGYIDSMILNTPGAFGPFLGYLLGLPGFLIGIIVGLIIESAKLKRNKLTASKRDME